jgi:hypothetical protein
MMSHYGEHKKVKRIASVIYILVMAFIVIGTTLSEQQKTKKTEVHSVSNP